MFLVATDIVCFHDVSLRIYVCRKCSWSGGRSARTTPVVHVCPYLINRYTFAHLHDSAATPIHIQPILKRLSIAVSISVLALLLRLGFTLRIALLDIGARVGRRERGTLWAAVDAVENIVAALVLLSLVLGLRFLGAGDNVDDALDVAVLGSLAAFWHNALSKELSLLLARFLDLIFDRGFGILATMFEDVGLVVVG